MIVVIPAYQPDEKLLKLVAELSVEPSYKIVIVNDGSRAECKPVFDALPSNVILLVHEVNAGKGQALKTAYTYIQENFSEDEGVVTVDADGQHLVADIAKVCAAWESNKEALVLGSRRFTGKVPLKSRLGNAITRVVFRMSTGVSVYDTQTGLRAFGVSTLPLMLKMKGARYEYEINVLLYATRMGMKIIETTIDTVYIEDNASSHFNPFLDAWRIYKMIFLFVASSIIGALLDFVLLLLFARLTELMPYSLLISVVGARVISSMINFLINRIYVFEDRSNSSLARYYMLVLAVMGLNYGLLHFADMIMPLALGKVIVEVLLYPLSFYMQRKFVFTNYKG